MSDINKDLHPKIIAILEKETRSDEWINSIDNGSGIAYKFDNYSDGTYVEAVDCVDWDSAVGDSSMSYLVTKGNLNLNLPYKEIESNNIETMSDIIFIANGYWGVESHYGGGDEVFTFEDAQEMKDEDYYDELNIVDKGKDINQYVEENYFN